MPSVLVLNPDLDWVALSSSLVHSHPKHPLTLLIDSPSGAKQVLTSLCPHPKLRVTLTVLGNGGSVGPENRID